MSNRVCKDCTYNNNGWCGVRKTNKGLKDLVVCEYKRTNELIQLEQYLEHKEFELKMDNGPQNLGFVNGLRAALFILKGKQKDEKEIL